ncbi:hypothetical protein IJ531_06035, partial [bacterium]|nr:hypothetical protein [bacterium]
MKILNINNYTPYKYNYNFKHPQKNSQNYSSSNLNSIQYNDYLMFTARVDKGLERFYAQNQDKMPQTLKSYINSLSSMNIAPIDAQFSAFEGLVIADDIEDVKDYYPDEPLFKNLRSIDDNKATRGFLYDVRVMRDVLDECDEDILQSGDDFTLYLLKKIFLEAKSLPEINNDLDLDLNPVFQKEDKNYLTYETLRSLGIQLPNAQYLTSLRFTKEGYSDEMGRRIAAAHAMYHNTSNTPSKRAKSPNTSSALQKYWASLTEDEKAEIARKRSRIQKERWQKLTPEEKTDIINRMQAG